METSASGADPARLYPAFYPARSLPENVCAFCDVLRRELDFRVGPGEIADALRALDYLGLEDLGRVRAGLRLVLCARQEDIGPFDRAFAEFFFPGGGVPQPDQPPTEPPRPRRVNDQDAPGGDDESRDTPEPQPSAEQRDEDFDGPAAQQTPQQHDPDAQPSEQVLQARMSAQNGEAQAPAVMESGLDAMLAAAAIFLAELRLERSRQWRPGHQGTRFDLRRTLRASLATGGEAISPRWQHQPRSHPRIVLLLDGSRSMEGHNAPVLQFAYALSQRSRRVDVFTFSTELRDVTEELQRGAGQAVRQALAPIVAGFRLPALGHAWGGGTRIGECLDTFVREHGLRLLGPTTVVIVASDGLDVGDPELLARSVQTLARRSRGVVWLNPLAALEGYAPTARGMKAALPHLKSLTHASTPQEFAHLARRARSTFTAPSSDS